MLCIAKACGDGILAHGEQCDDGNIASGDGCSSRCRLEEGYVCAVPGSACTTIPGLDSCVYKNVDIIKCTCGDGNATTATPPTVMAVHRTAESKPVMSANRRAENASIPHAEMEKSSPHQAIRRLRNAISEPASMMERTDARKTANSLRAVTMMIRTISPREHAATASSVPANNATTATPNPAITATRFAKLSPSMNAAMQKPATATRFAVTA